MQRAVDFVLDSTTLIIFTVNPAYLFVPVIPISSTELTITNDIQAGAFNGTNTFLISPALGLHDFTLFHRTVKFTYPNNNTIFCGK